MGVEMIRLDKLLTSLKHLRSKTSPRHFYLQQLPIRVVHSESEVGMFEVVDGFKRLKAALDNGSNEIEAVIEDAVGPEAKVLMIRANAGQKTLRPLDEARVIASLVDQDGFSLAKASRLLGRGRPWASKRYALIKRLSGALRQPVDEGRLALSVAYTLTMLNSQEQLAVAQTLIKTGLSAGDGLALISTYRTLADDGQRRALLQDPLGSLQELRQKCKQSSPLFSASAGHLQESYRRLREMLDNFIAEDTQVFAPAEARLLDAERRELSARIIWCARKLEPSAACFELNYKGVKP